MTEKSAKQSEFDGYINWLPKKLENLPHFWTKNVNELNLLGLKDQVDDDIERLENDWILAKKGSKILNLRSFRSITVNFRRLLTIF